MQAVESAPLVDVATDSEEAVAFRVQDQDFCCSIMAVREIRSWSKATKLPQTPDYVCGVINLRGSVVPVIDLARKLDLGQSDMEQGNVIIICVIDGKTVGLLAELVSSIITIQADDLQPIPDMIDADVMRYISGVVISNDKMISYLNLERVFEDFDLTC